MYWSSTTRYGPIADIMSRNRYQDIRLHLHANDNSKRDDPENKDYKLFKVEPYRGSCRNIALEQEENHSIEEQIIPAKTKHSGIRQYKPKKTKKLKNWVSKALFVPGSFFYIKGGKRKQTA